MVKNTPASAGDARDSGSILGQEDPLEEGMAAHPSVLAWRIRMDWIPGVLPEKPGRLQSVGLQRVSLVQSLGRIRLFATLWTAACWASLSFTISMLKLMSIELVMPSNHLILCCPFLLLPSIFPSIRVFSNESVLYIRWPKYWSFSFSISPSNEYSGLISFRID